MNNEDFINAQKVWSVPSQAMAHIEQTSDRYRLKHGMFASVPIICKAVMCPYFEICTVDPQYRILNSRCPMEIAAIIARYDMWCEHFGISLEGTHVRKEDVTDASLVRDLVDNEIQTIRAENKLAISGDFIGKTITQIDNKGKVYREDAITPAAEFKMTLQDKRYRILQLLNSTRKDKANQISRNESLSNKAISLIEKVKNALPNLDLDNLPDEPVAVAEDTVKKEE